MFIVERIWGGFRKYNIKTRLRIKYFVRLCHPGDRFFGGAVAVGK